MSWIRLIVLSTSQLCLQTVEEEPAPLTHGAEYLGKPETLAYAAAWQEVQRRKVFNTLAADQLKVSGRATL